MAHLTDLDLTAPADSLYSGGVVLNTWRARIDVLNDALGDITSVEADQIEAIGTTTISAAQWVYVGALDQGLTTTSTVTFGTINAFTLGGKLTAGDSEIEGNTFDINGGTIDGVTIGGAAAPTVTNLGTVTTCDINGGTIGGITFDGALTMSLGSDADGDVYFRSSNVLTRLAKGTATHVLTMGAAVPEWSAAVGAIDISGTPVTNDYARWTNANTLEGREVSEVFTDLGLAAALANLTTTEITELEAIGDTTISSTQWGYLGACGAGGGQLLAALATGESTQLEAIGDVTISYTQWGYLGGLDQALTQASSPTFAGLALGAGSITMSGSIGVTGTRVTKGWFTDLECTNAIAADITGDSATCSGLAASATVLATARTIGGVSFNGSANIVPNIATDTTPQLGGELDCQAHSVGFTQQTASGDGTTTIDWKLGNKFYFTFGGQNDTFTFTAPTHECNLVLVLKQDGTGSRLATWPVSVKWPAATAPTLSTGANDVDVICFYWDGSNYHGVASLDFGVPA